MKYLVQYEKLPNFCFYCGCIGHEVAECGDGVQAKDSCQWGDWLRVPFPILMIGREDYGSGRGRGHGRGRGRGGGRGPWFDEEVQDMDISTEVDNDKIRRALIEEQQICKLICLNRVRLSVL